MHWLFQEHEKNVHYNVTFLNCYVALTDGCIHHLFVAFRLLSSSFLHVTYQAHAYTQRSTLNSFVSLLLFCVVAHSIYSRHELSQLLCTEIFYYMERNITPPDLFPKSDSIRKKLDSFFRMLSSRAKNYLIKSS